MLVRAAPVVVTKGSNMAALAQALREEPPFTLTFPESESDRLENPPLPGLLRAIVDPSPRSTSHRTVRQQPATASIPSMRGWVSTSLPLARTV